MSVLINGMEMPKNCLLCPFCVPEADEENGEICILSGQFPIVNKDERNVECPLIEVPKHGRLIDADALLNLLNNCMFPSDMVTTMAVRMATNWIKEAPTIIEAEEEQL